MPRLLKMAKDLAPGDRTAVYTGRNMPEVVTVLAVVSSVQTVSHKVVLVTFRDQKGRDIHRSYKPHSTMKLQPSEGGS